MTSSGPHRHRARPAQARAGAVTAMALALALAGAACGGEPAPEPEPAPSSTTSSTVADVQNRNDRTTALGRLCWARRELVLGLDDLLGAVLPAQQGGPVERIRFDRGVGRMRAGVAAVTDELVPSDPDLPDALRSFQDQVIAAAARATPVLAEVPAEPSAGQATKVFHDLGALFNFGGFPGIRAYADAAGASPLCPDP